MTSPSGPQKGRSDPNSLARQVAERLAATGDDARRAHRRRQRFSLFGVGLGLLTVAAATVLLVIGAVAWLLRTPVAQGAAITGSPLLSCDTGIQASMVGEGDGVEVIGVSEDGAWFVVNNPGEGPRLFVAAGAVEIESVSLGQAACDALDDANVTSTTGGVLAVGPGDKGPNKNNPSTTLLVFVTTIPGSDSNGSTTSYPGVTFLTTSTTQATTTTTTKPPSTTTTTRPVTTTTHGSTSTSTTAPSTSTSTSTTTTMPTTTTTDPPTTTTTEDTTTTTEDPGTTMP